MNIFKIILFFLLNVLVSQIAFAAGFYNLGFMQDGTSVAGGPGGLPPCQAGATLPANLRHYSNTFADCVAGFPTCPDPFTMAHVSIAAPLGQKLFFEMGDFTIAPTANINQFQSTTEFSEIGIEVVNEGTAVAVAGHPFFAPGTNYQIWSYDLSAVVTTNEVDMDRLYLQASHAIAGGNRVSAMFFKLRYCQP